ncbi:hypothetical protein Micbo1qcDRAFT_237316 [Microdochium bolleyi]|uniref:SH3 domain-containing protein n=1 Tax=Microdochium bolleyi TaxID=196109 RepID=A0A136ILK5_9PEZI|nr:hypothetical protein Micbo1qcDRAFT_237316 [Microdochium bolleyi]
MATTPFKVKALFEYASNHEDDLPFAVGQIITVVEVEDADWYVGEYVDDSGTKHEGIFPQNFVEKYEPVAPPRPARSRKKDPENPPVALASPPLPLPVAAAPDDAPAPAPAAELPATESAPEPDHVSLESRPVPPPPPAAVQAAESEPRSPHATKTPSFPNEPQPASKAPEPVPEPAPTSKHSEQAAASSSQASPAKAPASDQRAPPPVAVKSNAFKDRIAAFNKPAAAPVTPFKPTGLGTGGTGFIKKPFVAPPPSRNAYIPPTQQAPVPKVYRREEDPEIKEREAEALENAEKVGLVPGSSQEGQGDDEPKPLSLKERMAMLQKQQAEQAQRHADAVARKAKPKRPSNKPRTESEGPTEAPVGSADDEPIAPLERKETSETTASRQSIDSTRRSMDESPLARQPLPNRRKSTRGMENDGNEADLSGAGDTTEGQEDLTERDDSDGPSQSLSKIPTVPAPGRPSTSQTQEKPSQDPVRRESAESSRAKEEDSAEEIDAGADEEEDIDPEVRRKEELRARMAKMSGGMGMGMMGMHGMLGMPPPPAAPAKKKKAPAPIEHRSSEHAEDAPVSPRGAPPVPIMMALPGMGQPAATAETVPESEEEVVEDTTPVPAASPRTSTAGERPPPPPVPSSSRPPPPPVPAGVKSPSMGSESDDELSESQPKHRSEDVTPSSRAPPPPIPAAIPSLPTSPRDEELAGDELSPSTSSMPPLPTRRNSKPPPIPGAAPPVPGQARPPPPPPPGHASRLSVSENAVPTPMQPGHLDNGEEAEGTDYEGDYDTDIASSAPHKDALKAHTRDDSLDGPGAAQSAPSVPPPVPGAAVPKAVPPPVPSQPAPGSRLSIDAPRAAPPPPPPGRGASYSQDDDYDPFNYNAAQKAQAGFSPTSVSPRLEDVPQFSEPFAAHQAAPPPPPTGRAPPPAPPSAGPPPARGSARQSLDIPRQSMAARRSVDAPRPPAETGFFANDIDLAEHTKWWLTPNGVPPVFQGRKDILVETQESTSSGPAGAVSVNKVVKILFQDYSQTIITVDFDPQDASSGELDQQHEAPPRTLRQDELERAYETYGMQIAQSISGKKDSVVGDGTPHGLVYELLKSYPEALRPVGTRAFGALVYSNIGNAATQTNDEIRAGDIVSIRNARFQGKHGPMHAKYSMEVGKPDHVAIVSEWDGTKKKVKAWEQGRENKKLKQESFKLDDLRSGEVKVWRVMPRSWIGWETAPN